MSLGVVMASLPREGGVYDASGPVLVVTRAWDGQGPIQCRITQTLS